MTTSENPRTGKEVPHSDFEIQMLTGAGTGNQFQDHASWHWMVNKLKEAGETPTEYILGAKRITDKKSRKEFILCTYVIAGQNYDGSPLTASWREWGVWYSPTFRKVFEGRRNRWIESDEVVDSTAVYEFAFTGAKTKIESPITGKMVPITDLFGEDMKFYVIADNNAKLKVSKDDWLSLDRDSILKKYDTSKNVQAQALAELTAALTKAQQLTGQEKS